MSAHLSHRPPAKEAGPELQVLARWEEFTGWLLEHTARWPRSVRFTLCQRIQNHALDVTEMLGADTFVHSTLNQRPVVTPDIEELLADTGQSAESLGDVTNFIARVSPDINVSHGDQVKLVVDTTKIHFFDQQTGNRVGTKPMEPATA